MAKDNKMDSDSKHFLIGIIAIVAIVSISFIAIIVIGMQSNDGSEQVLVGQAWGAGEYDCFSTCVELGTNPSVCNNRCSQEDVRQAIQVMENYGLLN